MNSILVFYQGVLKGYYYGSLELISLFAIFCGIFVIISKNPIFSVCAPFWIFYARIMSALDTVVYFIDNTAYKVRVDGNSAIVRIWYKPGSSSKSEMEEKTQHAIKGRNRSRIRTDDSTRGKFPMIYLSNQAGGQKNPISRFNKTDTHILDVHGTGTAKRNVCTASQSENKVESKGNNDVRESNTGFPKSGDGYGDGASIVDTSRMQARIKVRQQRKSNKLASESTSMGAGGDNLLEKLFNQLKAGDIKVYQLLLCPELYKVAYQRLKSKPGNMTPGSDSETLDGISLSWLDKTINELKVQSFQFKPVRREYILKTNGKKRPLGIPSPRDKIVQEAMKMILEVIYEPTFLNTSHGFRPGRGCHSALKDIAKWNGITWAIEGDIKGYFDNVDHQILHSLLKNKIKDQKFLDLYWKLVKAGYVENNHLLPNSLGVPGIISPLLSNIYLHELDKFMEELKEKYSTPKERRTSLVCPTYMRVSRHLRELWDEYLVTKDKELLSKIKQLRRERGKIPSRVWTGARIHYCRYADDWIVGVSGTRTLAEQLKEEVKVFLSTNLKLELSEEKSRITHMKSERAKFLGTEITLNRTLEAKVVTRIFRGRSEKTRISQVRPHLLAPINDLLKKLEDKGFIKRGKTDTRKLVPKSQNKWINLEHRQVIIRYNEVIRGYLNYYSFADNYSTLCGKIVNYFLVHSCAKTLALKFKLKSRKAVFQKFGSRLAPKDELSLLPKGSKEIQILKQSTQNKTRTFKTKDLKDPLTVLNWGLRSKSNLLDDSCWICGEEEKVQAHHLKHIRKMNERLSGFSKIMAQLNRKQIPVCHQCHVKIHKGQYDGLSLKDLQREKGKRN
uniref:hypothetical protein n=1 Tax=Phyllosticta yuccae TaxID=1151444 RepID=UPI002799361B|nr:hypothetical protein QLP54_mgp35 [Phyllosticta yuccae]WGC90047.1 hypothetical protein [Phyllosticta yuccae]